MYIIFRYVDDICREQTYVALLGLKAIKVQGVLTRNNVLSIAL
jgi:hypothetical protein